MADDYYKHSHHLIEAIAEWERINGTLCAIMPHEALAFTSRLRKAAMKSECSARAALSSFEQGGEQE